MNKKIKYVRFITKGCKDFCFDSKYIKFMLINDIKIKMCLHDNVFEEERYINEFFIKLRFEKDNNLESKIKRLHKYNDVVRIDLIYDDTEIYYNIFDAWYGLNENIYQQSRFVNDNNLILKIDKHNTLDDYINIYFDFINDKELESLSREELIQIIRENKFLKGSDDL